MIRCYPPVPVRGQDFSNVKKVTVPKQSLSLREILKRYVRREPLPGVQDGTYDERFGDIEKLAKADIVVQMEKIDELKATIKRVRKKEADRIEAARLAALPPTPPPTPPAPVVST